MDGVNAAQAHCLMHALALLRLLAMVMKKT
jgi:hypothetical protein